MQDIALALYKIQVKGYARSPSSPIYPKCKMRPMSQRGVPERRFLLLGAMDGGPGWELRVRPSSEPELELEPELDPELEPEPGCWSRQIPSPSSVGAQYGPQTKPEQVPNRTQTGPKWAPNGSQTAPNSPRAQM